jgi:quinol monooxygenase YgiN
VLIIAGSLSFDPSDRDDVLASLAEVTEASRRDAGCVEYFWSEDLQAANTFRFFECWESQELFDAHIAQPHEVAFGERNLQRITGAAASFFEASSSAPSGVPRPD